MKIAVWYNNNDIRIQEVEKPTPGPNEMLVKVMSCGICGSDVVEWYRLPKAPFVPGHEMGGVVVETGESVSKYQPGDRVFMAPKVPCMNCRYCKNGHFPVCRNVPDRLPGGFSEYILVPEVIVENGTYILPESMSYDLSTFIEPLACAIRAQRSARVKKNQTLMIIGCGISGLIHIKLAKLRNCMITALDINPKRLEFARQMGAEAAVCAGTAEDIKKTDTVILCTSAVSAVDYAWQYVDKGGVIVFFAVPGPESRVTIPINGLWMNEIQMLTSYYCGPQDIVDAIRLIETEAVTFHDMISHQLPLNEISKGFGLVADAKDSIKVIIHPNDWRDGETEAV
jgi:L-iditol 2-dehydrogenase